MGKYTKRQGPDTGQNSCQLWCSFNEEQLGRIKQFRASTAIPGTSQAAVIRFLVTTGLEFLEHETKRLHKSGVGKVGAK